MTTAAILTLGCRLNQADTALLSGRLRRMGLTVRNSAEGCDVILVNSCAVTATAARKSRQTLRHLRSQNPDSILILTGCAAEKACCTFGADDGIDLILGNEEKKSLEERLAPLLKQRGFTVSPFPEFHPDGREAVFTEQVFAEYPGRSRAALKIQEGCNNFCSYCIVPYTRGRERSRDSRETLDEFKRLLDAGFQEITITGINTCTYSCGGMKLPDLLEKLIAFPGEFRIRIGSTEPGEVLLRVLDVMAESEGKICAFLHPSLQHGSDEILRSMNRHYLTGMYREFVEKAREKIPDLHIGTDLIVGFPGETERLFEESYEFVRSIGFSNLHVFPFSPREGTRAFQMPHRVPEGIIEERAARLRALGETMAENYRRSLIGTEQTVIPEECSEESGEGWSGNYVRVRILRHGLRAGKLVRARITGMDFTGILTGE